MVSGDAGPPSRARARAPRRRRPGATGGARGCVVGSPRRRKARGRAGAGPGIGPMCPCGRGHERAGAAAPVECRVHMQAGQGRRACSVHTLGQRAAAAGRRRPGAGAGAPRARAPARRGGHCGRGAWQRGSGRPRGRGGGGAAWQGGPRPRGRRARAALERNRCAAGRHVGALPCDIKSAALPRGEGCRRRAWVRTRSGVRTDGCRRGGARGPESAVVRCCWGALACEVTSTGSCLDGG
jgi:hypothetical protein